MPQLLPGLPAINVYIEESCRRGANCDWKDLRKEFQWSKEVNLSLFWCYFFMYMFFSLRLIRSGCVLTVTYSFMVRLDSYLWLLCVKLRNPSSRFVYCVNGVYEFQLVGVRQFVWWLIAFIAVYLVNVLELA